MRRQARGSMLVWALFALVVITGLLFAGMENLRSSAREAEARFHAQGQALDVARAGIVDAYAWFRRQTTQPVGAFAPALDLAASPPVNETDDPALGLVRDFEISPGYHARYEVRRYLDLDHDGLPDPGEGVSDATARRALGGAGTAWHLESRGFVYRLVDPAAAWDVPPNGRVAGAVVATEIRRLSLVPPGQAALCCARGDAVAVGTKGRVDGAGAAGLLYAPSTGAPTSTGQLTGSPGHGSVAGYDASVDAVFGVPLAELRALANLRLPGGSAPPQPFPEHGVVFVEGDMTVTSAAPLRGTGILFVDGDLTIAAGSNAYFSGLVYVTGDYSQSAPSLVRGAAIVNGRATVAGAADFSELVYEGAVIDRLLQQIGRYRISRALHRVDQDAIGGVR